MVVSSAEDVSMSMAGLLNQGLKTVGTPGVMLEPPEGEFIPP